MIHARAATTCECSPGGDKLTAPALGAGDGDVSEGGEATATAMTTLNTVRLFPSRTRSSRTPG